MYKVDAQVAYPDHRTRYPFQNMEVGDSILFPNRKLADNARISAMRFVRTHQPEWKFSMRTVEGGFRLWRIK